MFNFKFDKRTLFNILKIPAILFIRIPIATFFMLIEYIYDWSDIINDKLPGWDSGKL